MKQLIIAGFFLVAGVTTVFAGRPSKAENDAAMKSGRQMVASKTTVLQQQIQSRNTAQLKSTTTELLSLMRQGMVQLNREIPLETGDQQKASFVRYNNMEKIVFEYSQLSTDPVKNSAQLLDHVKAFSKLY